MFFNYLKISLRHLTKNKSFSIINILGLTLGFVCFILLSLYVYDELSFDTFHRDAGHTYRLLEHKTQDDGSIRTLGEMGPAIGREMQAQFPVVEDYCRLSASGRTALGNDPANRMQERVLIADPNFFSFFDFPLLEGDPQTALMNPDAIVVSERMAKKYFGNESPMGKQIWSSFTRNQQPIYFTVTGVMKNFPKNSHLQIDMFVSDATFLTMYDDYKNYLLTNWSDNEYTTYVKLKPGADPATLAKQIGELVKANYPANEEYRSEFVLQPFTDVHLHSEAIQGQPEQYNARGIKPFYIYMFGAVGFLLLLIACLNYMNLSTAAAIKRTREIGTRKTLGAKRTQLVIQFISDSLILSLFSLLVALVIVELLLPLVNTFTDKEMVLTGLPFVWMAGLVLIMLIAGLLSAMYPALVSAGVSAAQALKKEIRIANQNVPVRKLLLGAQFFITIAMIASTLVIYRQLKFMREKDLGFDREGLLVIDINSRPLRQNFETVKSEFSSPTEVVSITASTRVPGEWKSFPIVTINRPDGQAAREQIFVGIDKDFLETYDLALLEGRTIEDPIADSLKVVLTKSGAQALGLTDPIGQMIEMPAVRFTGTAEPFDTPFRVQVIGIVEDFHFESLRREMMPVVFGAPNTMIHNIDYYTLRVKTSNWDQTIKSLKAINSKLDPNQPLEYTFLDDRFEEFYRADEKRGQIFLAFSLVIVLIASMGLYALVSYSVESRTKEIGVRKVLGASVQSIVGLVSREFLVLVGFACIVAIPVSYFFMQEWLNDFAYRITLGVGSFVLAGILTAAVALATISLRTARAARENPVRSLRSE